MTERVWPGGLPEPKPASSVESSVVWMLGVNDKGRVRGGGWSFVSRAYGLVSGGRVECWHGGREGVETKGGGNRSWMEKRMRGCGREKRRGEEKDKLSREDEEEEDGDGTLARR